ncbi:MAG: zinc-binding dehydrogenase [Pseudomonadota bacterium]
MKAAFFLQHGDTDQIQVDEFKTPDVGPHDVLIRVRAASLNGFDPMILQGATDLQTPLPMIPLGDFAGEIAKIGSSVQKWRIGDRVCPFPYVMGDGMMGETRLGAAAEYVAMPAVNLLRLPENVSFEEAACLPIAYGAALRMMYDRAKVRRGETVLILGATGGVGVCALQLAKAAGCEVIACGGAEWKLQKLKEIGADHVINTSKDDFQDVIASMYGKPAFFGGGGVDVVVNYIGGDTWVKSLKCLTKGGRLMTCGATAGFSPEEDIRYIWSFELNIMGSNGWLPPDQVKLLDMAADGRLQPYIHAVRPLEQTASSIQQLIDRDVFGKIVITP